MQRTSVQKPIEQLAMTHPSIDSLSSSLWREVSSTRFEALPPAVIEKVKMLTLDTVGVALGSSTLEFGVATRRLVNAWGSSGRASMVGEPTSVPPHAAAFANGVLAHGQDFDDTHTESVTHPSSCIVPAVLAMAEARGKTGRDAIVTIAAGLETMIRLALPARNQFHLHGFHTTSITGTFASAVCAALMEELPEEAAVNAMGIAGSFTSGLLECVPAGADSKRLHAGWAAMSGIIAAELAKLGMTGPSSVLEGKLGLFNSFVRGEPIDHSEILNDYAQDWLLLDTRPKLYPCCHYLQSFIDCALQLRSHVDLEHIKAIHCKVAAGSVNMICEPWAAKQSPRNTYEAKFSLPFAIAIALADGHANTENISVEHAMRPEISRIMSSVSYEVAPAFDVKDMPGEIRIELKDGTFLEHAQPAVRGDRNNPISPEEILKKFHDNLAKTPYASRATLIAERIFQLETLEDLEPFGSLLRGS